MKQLNIYITEKLKLRKDSEIKYKYHPQDKEELSELLKQLFIERGMNANLNDIDTSKITDMSNLFAEIDNCSEEILSIGNIDISKWDVSKVTNMYHMFSGCEEFNCDLSNWDVSNVYNMGGMFNHCSAFTAEGLETWNVSKLEVMSAMFFACEKFTGKEIEDWNMPVLNRIDWAFAGCIRFNANLSKWDVSKVDYSERLFEGCKSFTGKGIENWDVSKWWSFKSIFRDTDKFNADLSKWNVSKGVDFEYMFFRATGFEGKGLENWKIINKTKINYFTNMFAGCNNLKFDPAVWKLGKRIENKMFQD